MSEANGRWLKVRVLTAKGRMLIAWFVVALVAMAAAAMILSGAWQDGSRYRSAQVSPR